MSALPDGAGPVSGIGRSTRGTDVLKSVTANALVSESVEITLRTVDVKHVWTLQRLVLLVPGAAGGVSQKRPSLFADLDIDTSTPAGEMAANIIIAGSQYERRLIFNGRDALALSGLAVKG